MVETSINAASFFPFVVIAPASRELMHRHREL